MIAPISTNRTDEGNDDMEKRICRDCGATMTEWVCGRCKHSATMCTVEVWERDAREASECQCIRGNSHTGRYGVIVFVENCVNAEHAKRATDFAAWHAARPAFATAHLSRPARSKPHPTKAHQFTRDSTYAPR